MLEMLGTAAHEKWAVGAPSLCWETEWQYSLEGNKKESYGFVVVLFLLWLVGLIFFNYGV